MSNPTSRFHRSTSIIHINLSITMEYTVNAIIGTRTITLKRVRKKMDALCQYIIAVIHADEVQKLATLPGVGYASFGSAVSDPPEGTIVADGWLEIIDITAFHENSNPRRIMNWYHAPRWTATVNVTYTGIAVFYQEGVGEANRPERKVDAVELLRGKFRAQYGV